jgi:hypothetical protein
MIQFSRSILVTMERPNDDRVVLHGILEDNIYAMDVNIEISRLGCAIEGVSGQMRRYTTSECPKATAILRKAVGMKVDVPGFASRINKEIGRQGCRHYAELIIECIDTFITSELAVAAEEARVSGVKMTDEAFQSDWVKHRPILRDSCLAMSQESSES